MEITYEIVPADIFQHSKEAAKGKLVTHIGSFTIAIVILLFVSADILLAVVAVFKNDGTIKITDPQILLRLVVGMAIWLGSYLFLVLVGKFGSKKLLQAPGKNGLFCEHKILFEETGFTESTDVNRSFHSWEGVDKIAETAGYVTIYVRLGQGYFIPKRAFPSKQAVLDFIDAVPANIARTFQTELGDKKPASDY
ncbi:MAG: YcxB family protein [Pyrinomonadaceae bacterium]